MTTELTLRLATSGDVIESEVDSSCPEVLEKSFQEKLLLADTPEERLDLILENALQGEMPELLTVAEGRQALCEYDPLLFAVLYFAHHLKSEETGNELSFSRIHLELCDLALSWTESQTLESHRDAVIAPRGSGKTTWLFLILPLWALAFGHVKFIAAFSDVSGQAEEHLATARRELSENQLLRNDYPDFCTPLTRPSGAYEPGSDTISSLMTKSGAIFMARGVDRPVRGLKVGRKRPDLLLLDDVEKGEATYSPVIIAKRLETIKTDILMLELAARVVFAGTTTRSDSIIHQLVQSIRTTNEPEQWVTDLKFKIHYYPALETYSDGHQSSIWPQRWSLTWLLDNIHRDDILQELQNDPQSYNPSGWQSMDFKLGSAAVYDRTILSIDGAVTTKNISDYTGLAVLSGSTKTRKTYVHEALGVRLGGEALRRKCLDLVLAYPEIVYLLIESNQGGDLWRVLFHDFPVKIHLVHQSEPKEYRIKRLQTHYQRGDGSVRHVKKLVQLEDQAKSWPHVQHDDILDAVATGEWHLVNVLFKKQTPPSAQQIRY